ncbi:MAG: Beta-carotene ketolase [uncultured Chthoniobacterales bacterium]|uniref:Beta-carotene ketolase n=1 Tax=uncultured Chthoniobacterales bacterium TaxID=1836801 RepID=A0A6J4HRD0_9BACT|nr:MAG: Beta-carotene ketolase [uncultured Chthoniobacterales bacterium]
MKSKYDVVILGAGHNGLVAAAYLARAGLSVLLLEKNDYIGGATTSQQVFPDYDARLSRYSYLVSLFPEKIIRDLGLKLELRRRTTGSFTPYVRDGRHDGLLLSNIDEEVSRQSMRRLTGDATEFEQMKRFYQLARVFAEHSWDSMLEPLVGKEDFRRRFEGDQVAREAWRSLAEEPLGRAIERYLQNDLVRGLVLTDAKIGIFTHPHDPSLIQNCCFLYHLIGNKTGEWKVPVGGMGAVAAELEKAARMHGAEMVTDVCLTGIQSNGVRTVAFEHDGKRHQVDARFLLVNFGRNVLANYLGEPHRPAAADEGSVFKINMLLRRLPKLKATRYAAADAFRGTFHTDEGYEQMNASYEQALGGKLPEKPPSEVYCHTLTDDSILSPELRAQGFHTMTLFGIDTPWSVFAADNAGTRGQAQAKFLASMNQWLDEPLEDCLAIARDGSLCIESKSPVDIEEALGLYHGNIFQDAPTFPFARRSEQVGTWGVETEFEHVFLCGSSAHRGGAVSGIPGHNAAMKVLESSSRETNVHR